MSLPDRGSRPPPPDDALLSGLSRLKASDAPKQTHSHAGASHDARPRPQRPRAAPALNVPYAYFPQSPPGRRVDPMVPVSRVDTLEVIEHATGLGRSDGGDVAAADKLLKWIRAGSVDPVDVFRAIVAGSALTDAALNARVLSVVAWLCVVGGPLVLPPAVYITNPRKPTPALRICLDVLRSLGYDEAPEDVLYDDNKVREMKILGARDGNPDVAEVRGGRRTSPRMAMLVAAVEAYAISLGRKLIFHNRYPEVEANYSLDRYFRKMHIENRVDAARQAANMERHSIVISKVTLAEMTLITHSGVVAADLLERAGAPSDITIPAIAEACNAYSFSQYLLRKTGASNVSDFDMEDECSCLADKLQSLHKKGGADLRILKRFVEQNVIRAIMDPRLRANRPESKHRREILCTFTSFESLHRALAPHIQGHRDIAD